MTTEADLLRAICIEPQSDELRLVYADWLEEHDQTAKAEFIRRCLAADALDRWPPGHYEWLASVVAQHGLAWFPAPAGVVWDHTYGGWLGAPGATRHVSHGADVCLRRGLPDEAYCHLLKWLRQGPALAKLYPITKANLDYWLPAAAEGAPVATRERAARRRTPWAWIRGNEQYAGHVPVAVFDCLSDGSLDVWSGKRLARFYHDQPIALDDLDRAGIVWARKKAKLPPLPQIVEVS